MYFVFNGDADGISAAHQLYLNNPSDIQTVTGVKRDISLLKKISNLEGQDISVFDIAIEKNLAELKTLLQNNCRIKWFDHHLSEEIPQHTGFEAFIDTDPTVNTSLIVSRYLDKTSGWTIVGLYGDNMAKTAESLAAELDFRPDQLELLKEMGELLNYNAYGENIDDLHFAPAKILEIIRPYQDPFTFLDDNEMIAILRQGQADDLAKAEDSEQLSRGVVKFPAEKWARRVVGVYANQLSNQNPDQTHAVLVEKENGKEFVVSVRSAKNGNKSAAEFCKQFPTGGGRIKAAGINVLPKEEVPEFINSFNTFFND